MKTSNEIKIGSIVCTVSPTGKPNFHTSRIGRGRVVSLHTEYDGAACRELPHAFVCFFDGKRGSWPIERLKNCGR